MFSGLRKCLFTLITKRYQHGKGGNHQKEEKNAYFKNTVFTGQLIYQPFKALKFGG